MLRPDLFHFTTFHTFIRRSIALIYRLAKELLARCHRSLSIVPAHTLCSLQFDHVIQLLDESCMFATHTSHNSTSRQQLFDHKSIVPWRVSCGRREMGRLWTPRHGENERKIESIWKRHSNPCNNYIYFSFDFGLISFRSQWSLVVLMSCAWQRRPSQWIS